MKGGLGTVPPARGSTPAPCSNPSDDRYNLNEKRANQRLKLRRKNHEHPKSPIQNPQSKIQNGIKASCSNGLSLFQSVGLSLWR
jgi:hypothetical protein